MAINFDDAIIYKDIKLCNLSDTGVVNAYYGESAFATDGSNGQVMVEIPTVYFSRVVDSRGDNDTLDKFRTMISDTPDSGFKPHRAFLRKDNTVRDHIYIGSYEGSIYDTSAEETIEFTETGYTTEAGTVSTSEDKLQSISGVTPAPYLTRANFRTLAHNRGDGWGIENVWTASLLYDLMSIEAGQHNAQSKYGNGVVSKSYTDGHYNAEKTGGSDTIGDGTGYSGTNGTSSVRWRGIEDPWGNLWRFIDGGLCVGDGTQQAFWVSPYDEVTSDTATTDLVKLDFAPANENGYILRYGMDESFPELLMAKTVGGTAGSSTPVGDYHYQNHASGTYYTLLLGGSWRHGLYAGPSYWYLAYGASDRWMHVGARLVYRP